jgi:RNA polymerase sigma-70 factor, ECF subfamily
MQTLIRDLSASELSDEEVIERVLAGDTGLYELLMRRYNQRVYRAVRAVLRDDAEAEDVMQESYVRAFQHLSRFEQRSSFCTWVTRIAVNESLARLEKKKKFTNQFDEEGGSVTETLETKAMNPEEAAASGETRGLLESAIMSLPYPYRMVVMLRDVEELNTAEAAQVLELSEDTVKVRLHRARAMLRKELFQRAGAKSTQAFQFMGARCDRVVAGVMEKIQRLGARN